MLQIPISPNGFQSNSRSCNKSNDSKGFALP